MMSAEMDKGTLKLPKTAKALVEMAARTINVQMVFIERCLSSIEKLFWIQLLNLWSLCTLFF